MKAMFSNKYFKRESIILSENLEVAEPFNVFFLNIVKEIIISLGQEFLTEADHIEGPVLRIIARFKEHPSVVAIFENDTSFSFKYVSLDEITKEIKR